MLVMLFESFSANLLMYPGSSLSARISLEGMECSDGTTAGTIYPHLIKAKKHSDGGVDFFTLTFEHQPLDERADNCINIRMLPLQVVYNPVAIKSIISFFTVPASKSSAFSDGQISALRAAAMGTFQGITTQTRLGLEHAIEDHKTLDLKVDIDAPIFIFPERYSLC